jgi:hypothetical protein
VTEEMMLKLENQMRRWTRSFADYERHDVRTLAQSRRADRPGLL